MKTRGFTLIELLVTVTIIAVLSAIGLVIYHVVLEQGRDSKRQSDLRTIQSALEQLLRDTVLPGRAARIDYRWSGVMGFSAGKQPIVRLLSDRIALGFGCNGMGVALGADIAMQTAGLLA